MREAVEDGTRIAPGSFNALLHLLADHGTITQAPHSTAGWEI